SPTQGATKPMPAVPSPRHPTTATRRQPARGRVITTGTTGNLQLARARRCPTSPASCHSKQLLLATSATNGADHWVVGPLHAGASHGDGYPPGVGSVRNADRVTKYEPLTAFLTSHDGDREP